MIVRILVVGAGATGGYFGARLAMADRDVTFLVRPRRAAELSERGLRITGQGEDVVLRPKLVTADRLTTPYDLILLSVKATALDAALADITPAVGPDTTIVPFLNGMAHLDALNARFGKDRVLGGVVFVMTVLDENGDVVRLAPPRLVGFGEQDGTRSARLREVAAALGDAGFDTPVFDDVIGEMWSKWVFISSIGALTCLMRAPIGDVVAAPGGDGLGPAIVAEGASVAAAAGYPVPEDRLASLRATVTEPGSPTSSSMYRDLVAGAPTEHEHVLGDLVARARELSVATPMLDLATMSLRVHQRRTHRA
jgi:2-dehydropantoate 2-reductase